MISKLFILLCAVVHISVAEQPRVAIAHLVSVNVTGAITFTEVSEGIHVTGRITGLGPGKYGFHIHELGDISTCVATGAHFNPHGRTHGGPDHDHDSRHVGDLGNVEFLDNGTAIVDIVDSHMTLRGTNNIIGRALVLHEEEDDLGLGGNEGSLTTGNAGGRVACAVVGILSPVQPWTTDAASVQKPTWLVLSLLTIYGFFARVM